jgi:hypothetical protein
MAHQNDIGNRPEVDIAAMCNSTQLEKNGT